MAKYSWPWGKCLPLKVELKESVGAMLSDPATFPADVDGVFGIVYVEKPEPNMTADNVYALACGAEYFRWQVKRERWRKIGNAGRFLALFGRRTHHAYSWPEQIPGQWRSFHRPDAFQVLAIRELLRRHLNQRAYIFDYDLCIFDGRDYETH